MRSSFRTPQVRRPNLEVNCGLDWWCHNMCLGKILLRAGIKPSKLLVMPNKPPEAALRLLLEFPGTRDFYASKYSNHPAVLDNTPSAHTRSRYGSL